ncbi:MAG: hypothetical protein AAFO82_13005, partial [Bacteroidota bacterium]
FPVTRPDDLLTPMPEPETSEPTAPAEEITPEPAFDPPTPSEVTEPVSTSTTEASFEYVYTPSAPLEAFRLRTNAPRHTGVYYKIQIIALADFSFNDPRFQSIKDWMRLDYELIVDKGVTRALLADFFNLTEATKMLAKVKTEGFPTAFIVKYEDGERVERVRL